MPAESGKQYRLMQAVMHGKTKKKGLSKKVARHYVQETPSAKRSMFASKKNK